MPAGTTTLAAALTLRPDHLSCYQLTIEEGTPFAERCHNGEIALPDDAIQADFFFATSGSSKKTGFVQYEVSNFARRCEAESRHNKKYWDHTPYLGLGPAAHSFDGRRRSWNVRSVDAYLGELAAGRLPVAASETLTPDQLRMEALFLGFRTKGGESGGFQKALRPGSP